MDGTRFDQLARSLAAPSRRGFLKGALAAAFGGAVAAAGLAEADAAVRKRQDGRPCTRASQCLSGVCGPADARRKVCGGCTTASDCPAPVDACLVAACTAGVCSTLPVTGTDCGNGVCAAPGTCCPGSPTQTDCPGQTDGNCYCVSTAEGTVVCITGGQQCVQPCTATSDCPAGFACLVGNGFCQNTCHPAGCVAVTSASVDDAGEGERSPIR